MKSYKLVITALSLGLTLLTSCSKNEESTNHKKVEVNTTKLESVRAKGEKVMPFDLDSSKHFFIKNKEGGVEEIRAMKPEDSKEVRLIQEHLKEIANDFTRGDYSKVKSIHGYNMPGVKKLEEEYQKVKITYQETEFGAKLIFKSKDSLVLEAIHSWFDAQLAEHGNDASDREDETSKEVLIIDNEGVDMSSMSGELMCKHHPESCNSK